MYVSNPFIPKVRRLAVNDVLVRGLTQKEVALKYGIVKSTICKWIKKAENFYQNEYIDTFSSRPHHHPNELSQEVIERIIELRKSVKRCAPIIHAHLLNEGINVSLSSVGRVLKRNHLVREKRAHFKLPLVSPLSSAPGSLVEADTIHYVRRDHSRFYIYSVLDTYSRLAYAEYHKHITPDISLKVVTNAAERFGFPLQVIQTDHGEEFSQSFYFSLQRQNIPLKYIRTRKPNDNAHIERFNRTLQEECFSSKTPSERFISRQLNDYLVYYNEQRLHLSLHCLTPRQFVSKVLK